MAHINLLEWRKEARKLDQTRWIIIFSAIAIAALLIVVGINTYYEQRVSAQLKRNAYLTGQIEELDQRIAEIATLNQQKQSLQQRMRLIEQLQSSRNSGTQIFNEISQVVPPGVYLTQIEKKGNALLIVGRSESNNRLATMMRKIEESELLSHALIESITAGEEQPGMLSDFRMQVRTVSPVQPNDSGSDVASNEQGGQ